jgi:hypothetical protein
MAADQDMYGHLRQHPSSIHGRIEHPIQGTHQVRGRQITKRTGLPGGQIADWIASEAQAKAGHDKTFRHPYEDAFARHLASLDGMESLLRQAEEYRVNAIPKEVLKATDIPGSKRLKASFPSATVATSTPTKPFVLFTELQPKTSGIALRSILDEAIWQCRSRRDISTAPCLRMVLEISMQERIQRDFKEEHPNVSEKGIAAPLNLIA